MPSPSPQNLPSAPRFPWGAVALFILIASVSAILTMFGVAELISQLGEARSFKAGAITIVLESGLVLVGPVVLLTYFKLMPRATFKLMARAAPAALTQRRLHARPNLPPARPPT